MFKIRSIALLLALVAAPSAAFAQTSGPIIDSTPPCIDPAKGYCARFFSGGFDVQSIAFRAPSRGKAIVTIDGTAQCVNAASAPSPSRGVVDFSAQIIDADAAPDPTGPGGQRFSARLEPASNVTQPVSQNVNLSTRRVFDLVKGQKTFRYRIQVNRIDTDAICTIFNAYMTVLFSPR